MTILIRNAALLLTSCAVAFGQAQPKTIFKEKIHLSDSEIQQIDRGQIVIKLLDSGDPKYGILAFGAVYVNAPASKFGTVMSDIHKLSENKVYKAFQEFSVNGAAPKLSDFDRLNFENKDIDELEKCKPGDCDIQIIDVAQLQKAVNWKAPDKYAQANNFLREKVQQGMEAYLQGGLKAIGAYRDRSKPLNMYDATKGMIDASFFLSQDKAGPIYNEVINYPEAKVPGGSDFFYWEKIDFGQGPTNRVSHVMLFPQGAGIVKSMSANLQLYASRYMRVALQMYYCIPDTSNPSRPGFYLVEMNDSQMPDFGGIKLSIVRKIASSKATDSTRDALTMYQKMLEGQ